MGIACILQVDGDIFHSSLLWEKYIVQSCSLNAIPHLFSLRSTRVHSRVLGFYLNQDWKEASSSLSNTPHIYVSHRPYRLPTSVSPLPVSFRHVPLSKPTLRAQYYLVIDLKALALESSSCACVIQKVSFMWISMTLVTMIGFRASYYTKFSIFCYP